MSECGGCPEHVGTVEMVTMQVGDLWAGVLKDDFGRLVWASAWMGSRDEASAEARLLLDRWQARAVEQAQVRRKAQAGSEMDEPVYRRRQLIWREDESFVPFGDWEVVEAALPLTEVGGHPGIYHDGRGGIWEVERPICPFCGWEVLGPVDGPELPSSCGQEPCLSQAAEERSHRHVM